MRLTQRDIQILSKVNECHWLSTSQLKRYFFAVTTHRAINRRLKLLVDDGYLFCDRTSSTEDYFFRLGSKGKAALVEAVNFDAEYIHIPRMLPTQLKHFSTINDLRWYCERSIQQKRGIIEFFYVDRELKGLLGNSPIVPDALVSFTLPHHDVTSRHLVAIEYDARTENPQYFGRDKVKKYYDSAREGQQLFAQAGFHVLVVADTRKRVVQLLKHSMKFLNRQIRFLFGSLEDLQLHGNLFAAILIDPQQNLSNNSEGMCSLLQ